MCERRKKPENKSPRKSPLNPKCYLIIEKEKEAKFVKRDVIQLVNLYSPENTF